MAARRMGIIVVLCLLALFGDSYGTEFVPVFIWGSKKPSAETATPALKKYSTDDFEDYFHKKLSAFGEKPVVLVFTEENLSVEDFSWQDQAENTVFSHLQTVSTSAPEASFIPSVENPLKALKRLEKQGFKWIVVKDADAIQIPRKGGVVVVLKMDDARGDEDRPDFLRRHDRKMSEIYTLMEKERGNVIAVYTGHYCSWTEPENEPVLYRKRRLLAEPVTADTTSINMNTSFILMYAKSMPIVNVSGEVIYLLRDPIVTGDMRASYQSLSAKFSTNLTTVTNIKLEFFFYNTTSSTGYWVLENMTYSHSDTKITLRPDDNIIAPVTFSYHCSSETVFRANNTTITFKNFQAQPYLDGAIVFGDAYNCELFFTAPIWSGLFVTSILALIMIWGLVMIMDIRTMDQFDDPKGKTITISATD